MATYTLPSGTTALTPARAELKQHHNQRSTESLLSGFTQTTTVPFPRWGWGFTWGVQGRDMRQQVEAFLSKLNGREHRASLYDTTRPVRSGTCNLAGVTINALAAQFATTIVLQGCGNATTLKAGDWVQVTLASGLQQLVMVVDDATANAAGAMSINIRHPLRASVNAGSPVVLDHPRALYVMTEPRWASPRGEGLRADPFSVEFVEVFV